MTMVLCMSVIVVMIDYNCFKLFMNYYLVKFIVCIYFVPILFVQPLLCVYTYFIMVI